MTLGDYRQQILNCLNRNSLGLTITEISKKINGNRNTVSKYLNKLENEDLVFKKEIGKACLYFIKDIESKILYYISEKPSGVTIHDISLGLRLPKETVREHINAFTIQNKIFSKKIGAYNLYFSSEMRFVPKTLLVDFLKAIISDLKKRFPNPEEILKEIGKNIVEKMNFPVSNYILKKVEEFKSSPIRRLHFETFKDIFPSYYLYESIEVSDPKINKSGNKAIFQLKNSEFLREDDFKYHFYLISGMIETKMSNILDVPITCNVEKIHISSVKEDSYVEISIEFI